MRHNPFKIDSSTLAASLRVLAERLEKDLITPKMANITTHHEPNGSMEIHFSIVFYD